MRSQDSLIGRELHGAYRITARVGQGGMGVVYRASHLRLKGLEVAVKVLPLDWAKDTSFFLRFEQEAALLARLRHPGIVQVHDFNRTEEGHPYLVMELLDGETLSARLRRKPALQTEQIVQIIEQVAEALAHVHEHRVVHRDLKPQNIFLLSGSGAVPRVKLLDFGISKVSGGGAPITQIKNAVIGTVSFMSPEQGTQADLDHRSDIFSLATLAYTVLTRELPFGDTREVDEIEVLYAIRKLPYRPIRSVAPHLPPSVEEVFARAFQKDREKRTARVLDFATALKQALSGQAAPPGPEGLGIGPEAPAAAAPEPEMGVLSVDATTLVRKPASDEAMTQVASSERRPPDLGTQVISVQEAITATRSDSTLASAQGELGTAQPSNNGMSTADLGPQRRRFGPNLRIAAAGALCALLVLGGWILWRTLEEAPDPRHTEGTASSEGPIARPLPSPEAKPAALVGSASGQTPAPDAGPALAPGSPEPVLQPDARVRADDSAPPSTVQAGRTPVKPDGASRAVRTKRHRSGASPTDPASPQAPSGVSEEARAMARAYMQRARTFLRSACQTQDRELLRKALEAASTAHTLDPSNRDARWMVTTDKDSLCNPAKNQ